MSGARRVARFPGRGCRRTGLSAILRPRSKLFLQKRLAHGLAAIVNIDNFRPDYRVPNVNDLDLALQYPFGEKLTTETEDLTLCKLGGRQEQEAGLAHILDQTCVLFGQAGQRQRIVLNGQNALAGDRDPFRGTKLGKVPYVGL